jgi:hypothetical protein
MHEKFICNILYENMFKLILIKLPKINMLHLIFNN